MISEAVKTTNDQCYAVLWMIHGRYTVLDESFLRNLDRDTAQKQERTGGKPSFQGGWHIDDRSGLFRFRLQAGITSSFALASRCAPFPP
ncbi:hypothetical protein GbCGDNIH4_7144 [Granulibacter bethesdensis CGDNIH4]|nr:hypothetical protein GbCGDNIH4_7144 [Granulibacter bethesdensis CGDNIH4]